MDHENAIAKLEVDRGIRITVVWIGYGVPCADFFTAFFAAEANCEPSLANWQTRISMMAEGPFGGLTSTNGRQTLITRNGTPPWRMINGIRMAVSTKWGGSPPYQRNDGHSVVTRKTAKSSPTRISSGANVLATATDVTLAAISCSVSDFSEDEEVIHRSTRREPLGSAEIEL